MRAVQKDVSFCLLSGTGINEGFRTVSFLFKLPDMRAAA
jgi:hypothetical protein